MNRGNRGGAVSGEEWRVSHENSKVWFGLLRLLTCMIMLVTRSRISVTYATKYYGASGFGVGISIEQDRDPALRGGRTRHS